MICSFKNIATQRVYNQHFVKNIPNDVAKIALRKLLMIDNASSINDLRVPPGNRLEKLSGDRLGQYSIRINDQYRICFVERDGDFYDVEITDYHWKDLVVWMTNMISTPTIGEILKEEFMEPLGVSAYKLAHEIFVPVSRIQDIIHGRRQVSVDTSLRLGKYFGVSDDYFLKMQNDINLRNARVDLEEELSKIKVYK